LVFSKKLVVALVVLVSVGVVLTAVTAALLSTQQNIPSSGDIGTAGGSQSSGGGSGGSSDTGGSSGNSGNTVNTINVDVYTDAAATTQCSSIAWGTLSAGGSVTKIVYIKNTGNIAETLNMTATSWSPLAASSVLSLSWDKEGSSLAAGGVVAATLTLQVAADTGDVTSFNVNIIISGTAN
jgi:hypothetical protein